MFPPFIEAQTAKVEVGKQAGLIHSSIEDLEKTERALLFASVGVDKSISEE